MYPTKYYKNCRTRMGTTVKTTTAYPSVEEVFLRLMQADPEDGKNCVWIFKQYKGKLFRLEDIERVKEDLRTFIANRRGLPSKERSLENYNYSELKQVIRQFEPKFITTGEIKETEGDSTVLYSGEYGKLAIPLTQEASCRLGAGTKWCTAAREENAFETYNEEGPLYIWTDFKRGKEKFQFHFGEEFHAMDELDDPIDDELLKYYRLEHPILSLLFKEKEKEVMQDPGRAVDYAINVIKGRWPETEDFIMQYPNSAFLYALEVIKGRWLEAEASIMQNPHSISNYSNNVIKGRWFEAEDYIMQNPENAYLYALEVIKGRWLEAEPYIMKDPEYAYLYALEVIKGRWLEAEPYIMQDPEYAYLYAKYIMKKRWIEAEPYIIQNPNYTKQYEEEFNIEFVESS